METDGSRQFETDTPREILLNLVNFEMSKPFSIVEIGVHFCMTWNYPGIRIIHIRIRQDPPVCRRHTTGWTDRHCSVTPSDPMVEFSQFVQSRFDAKGKNWELKAGMGGHPALQTFSVASCSC